ncbi:MAG TPA: ATP phosphoribosyltransferase regulatory subunit [Peptococcaceae bacterium]|jgi:ATP phosphoribosyltransferase regulatory subunit|nr:ATP phosphoribosyltransferase regulatory subunit [Clostridia bacterium]HOB82210.1 ATP phosphoribosyltransferase regulatory subunit [Peptococcaceae bacterium]HPZ70915.1 ATP phosphoribosyltransferase regulatory subunit [Peptococcaceae bacterium]HQD54111.1 ATP phosphoribosyltransferase regulatory subunit [Peptococcaceae bacterium]
MNRDFLHIPPGMRDWLPGEAWRKRKLVNRLLKAISLWGYEEINTPLLEYYQVLLPGENLWEPDHLYKLTDRDGRILALRSEMTTPIARVVSSKLPERYPWRLMYGGEVFRYEAIQAGKLREFCQVGVELIGEKGPEADSEVLAIAIEALQAAGLKNFTISLGHTGVVKRILESFAADKTQFNQVRSLLLEKDFVGLGSCLLDAGMNREKVEELLGILTRQFTAAEVEQLPAGGSVAALEGLVDWPELAGVFAELQQTLKYLKQAGYERYIQVDLSTLRRQDYYTGMVFEIYTPGIGYTIGGGGRYDELLRYFGKDSAAVGFALGVERILISLLQDPEAAGTLDSPNQAPPVLVAGVDYAKVLERAQQYRRNGQRTLVQAAVDLTRPAAEERAQAQGAVLDWLEGEGSAAEEGDSTAEKGGNDADAGA